MKKHTPKQIYNWIKRASSKDHTRPVLTKIVVEHDKVYTTDGYRIHIAKIDLDAEYPNPPADETRNMLYSLGNIDNVIYDVESDETGCYPNVQRIVNDVQDKEVVCQMVIDAKHLREALTGITGNVTITLHGNTRPLEVANEDRLAIITPQSPKSQPELYRPAVFTDFDKIKSSIRAKKGE